MSPSFLEKSRKYYLASCLYDCIEDNDVKAVENILSEKCADPNILLPERGISPFHLAVGIDSEKTAEEIVKLFLKYNGNPNVRSEDNLTPVHIAAAWGRTNVLDLLLKCGGDPTFRDDDYMSALDYAYEENHFDIVQCLRKLENELIPERDIESDKCNLSLDKVIVNTGAIVAEYGVNNTDNLDNSLTYNLGNALQPLPKSTINSYVENWCIKHAEIININHDPLSYNRQTSHDFKSDDQILDPCKLIVQDKKSLDVTANGNDCCKSSADSESSEREYDNANDDDCFTKPSDKQNKYFSKVVSKRSKTKAQTEQCDESENEVVILSDVSVRRYKDSSRESGILTISSGSFSNNSTHILNKRIYLNSSSLDTLDSKPSNDYITSDEGIFNKNVDCNSLMTSDNSIRRTIVEITSDSSNEMNIVNANINSTTKSESDDTFFSISEEYKYIDGNEGIVLTEKRLLVNPKIDDKSSSTSKVSSLPATIDYDTDTLKRELTYQGEDPGPITRTTKRVYLKRLMRLKQIPRKVLPATKIPERVYSVELEKTLRNSTWNSDLTVYKDLEKVVAQQFGNPDPTKRWREGISKTSFTYLLLDPRITSNLPARSEKFTLEETWKIFLSSIFYVGKGKRSRPYSHLYEAVTHWHKGVRSHTSTKIQKILNIWQDSQGVVCLHVYQNVIPVEAYTREAAMISAIKLQNLDNAKSGDFYGVAAMWPERQKRLFGVYLLYRAMLIFLNEGERQLRPDDIDK